MKDGGARIGRPLEEKNGEIRLGINPYDETMTVNIKKADILKEELSPVSPMPPNLLNRLNEQEIVDLIAYLMAGGDPEHEIYTGEKEK
jgi:cytochrome c1